MAPRAPIAPLLPVAPDAGSLLQSVGAVPGEWRTGVAFESRDWVQFTWPDCVPDWESCTEETLVEKPIGSSDVFPECEQIGFDPFTIYTPVSEVSAQPDLARRLITEVGEVHATLLSATIAKVLTGQDTLHGVSSQLPFCTDENVNETLDSAASTIAGGPRAPLTAFAMLLHAYALEMGTTGGAMVHVPPVVLPFLIAHGIVAQVGHRFFGPGGSIIVADAGYAGISASPFTTATAWISGPVEVSVSGPVTIPGSEFADARLNQWAYVVEERAIYRFEPRSVFAIGVSTPVPGTGEV
jgi:hypothetical protein